MQIDCGADPIGRSALRALLLIASAGLAAWLALPGEPSRALRAVVLAPWLLLALAASRTSSRTRPRSLLWNGARWQLDGEAVQPAVMLDLGPWLLLRLALERGPQRWLGLTLSQAGAPAHQVRAALYAQGGAKTAQQP